MISYKGLGWLAIVFIFGTGFLISVAAEFLLGVGVDNRGLTIGIGIGIGCIINWFAGRHFNRDNTEHFISGMKMQNFSFLCGALCIVLIGMNLLGIN